MESTDIRILTEEIERKGHLVEQLRTGMHQSIVGQAHLVDSLLIGLLSGGHILSLAIHQCPYHVSRQEVRGKLNALVVGLYELC